MDKNSLSHTTWECKYHLVFAPKYRRQVIYGKIRDDVGKILRELCDRNGIEIIEALFFLALLYRLTRKRVYIFFERQLISYKILL